ncbi:MAG TPA: DUF308 domain-containing protein [Actinoplanes sp.]
MSTGGARRGRRDNGLDAADYAAAGDVDPRVGEHLLDVLAAGGIAAYLQPSADLNPILRATTFPGRPTDRLYVDRAHLAEARATLNRLTGGVGPIPPDPPRDTDPAGGSQREVDEEWARIIAGFDETVDPTTAPWPAAEAMDPPAPPPPLPSAADITGISLHRRRTDTTDPSLIDGLDTFGTGLSGDEERYVPPPPPPLPHFSKYAIAGVLSIIVGFVLFLRPSLLPIDRDFVTLIGFSAVIAGAVTLVWRLRSGEDDDDTDDGAIV